MTIVVVGGGPTGVELAGAFAELTRRVLKRDFRKIDPRQARVILLEADPRLLRQFSERLSAKAAAQLSRLGVEVRTNVRVENIGENFLQLAGGARIESANIIWTAGVTANPLTQKLGVELDRAGRVRVNPDLSLPAHPEVFAIGDLALVLDERGQPVPGISPAAMQMARHVAHVVETELNHGKENLPARPAFKYWNKGTMATIGRSAAVAQIGRLEFSGWPAWVTWLLVHLSFPHRLPQPGGGAVAMDLFLFYLQTRLAHHHGTGRFIRGFFRERRDAGFVWNEKMTVHDQTGENYDPNQTSLRTGRQV